MRIQGVVFDFDGVIVDSEARFMKIVSEMLRSLGEMTSEDELFLYVGIPPVEAIEIMKKLHPALAVLTNDDLLFRLKEQMSRSEIKPQAMPGVQEFFDFLKENRILTALATSRDDCSADELIDELSLKIHFDIKVTHKDVKKGKPDPETYLKVIEKFADYGIPACELIVIEDSVNGIASSVKAGLYTIGFKGSEVLQDTSVADIEIRDYRSLRSFILHTGSFHEA